MLVVFMWHRYYCISRAPQLAVLVSGPTVIDARAVYTSCFDCVLSGISRRKRQSCECSIPVHTADATMNATRLCMQPCSNSVQVCWVGALPLCIGILLFYVPLILVLWDYCSNHSPVFFILQVHGESGWAETTGKMVLSEPHWDQHIPLPKLGLFHSRLVTAFVALICFINSYDGDFVFDDSEAIINNKVPPL